MTQTLKEVYYSRLDEFQAGYEFHEHDEVVAALAVTGELLDLMFGGVEAPLAMTALRRIMAHGSGREWDWTKLANDKVDLDWRKAWGEIDGWNAASGSLFLDELHNLNAFANFGISPIWSFASDKRLSEPSGAVEAARLAAAQDMPTWVESVCQKIDHLERLAPRNAKGETALNDVIITRNIARARIKFDQSLPLTIHDLAWLSGVTAKRIQNAIYAKTDEAPVVDKNGLISPDSCEAWLAARDYRPSIWKQVASLYPLTPAWGEDIEFEAAEPDILVEDFTFVPVANDGSMFVPSLHRAPKHGEAGYSIGAKGAEQVIADYDVALEQLRKMETPRWRRPNAESNKWGIVTAQTWKRVRLAELRRL